MPFQTKEISGTPDVMAPDGAEVRILCQSSRGSMAHFALPPGAVSMAVAHHSIEELWYFVAGEGRMWRRLGEAEEVVTVRAGFSISLPVGTHFQFRCEGKVPLEAVAVAMPPWPGAEEAYPVEGPWEAKP
jgi:mannose-6-phosphate isomerase-like protein (cupin superfamily)